MIHVFARVVGATCCVVLACACSNAAHPPPGTISPQDDAGVVGADDASASEAGALGRVTDESDTPCAVAGGVPVTLYGADGGNAPALDRLRKLGAGRVAGSTITGGFVVFDSSGTNPTPAPITVSRSTNVFASEGVTVGMAGLESADIRFGRFDVQGKAVGDSIRLGPSSVGGLAIGGRNGESLVAWSEGDAMLARGIAPSGAAAGPAIALGAGFVETSFTGAVVGNAQDFAVIWTSPFADTEFSTFFARATTTARVGTAARIIHGPTWHQLVDAVKTPTGYAVLLNAGKPISTTVLAVLTEAGVVAGVRRLVGTRYGWALAALGNEIGVMATRTTGETEFRPFDVKGAALGPWVCLDIASSDGSEAAAVDSDGNGYAVIYRSQDGREVLRRFDRLGTGSP